MPPLLKRLRNMSIGSHDQSDALFLGNSVPKFLVLNANFDTLIHKSGSTKDQNSQNS